MSQTWAILLAARRRDYCPHAPACPQTCLHSEQLEALLGYPWPFPGRPPKHDLSTWTVTDDWPGHVPVAEAEIEVFERWFADLFDELFGPTL